MHPLAISFAPRQISSRCESSLIFFRPAPPFSPPFLSKKRDVHFSISHPLVIHFFIFIFGSRNNKKVMICRSSAIERHARLQNPVGRENKEEREKRERRASEDAKMRCSNDE